MRLLVESFWAVSHFHRLHIFAVVHVMITVLRSGLCIIKYTLSVTYL